jgi:hypothetical protein
MTNRSLKIIISITLMFSVLSCINNNGLWVEIKNIANSDISQITVRCTGNKKEISNLKKGKITKININPTGESNIMISYMLNNFLYKEEIDIYIEPSYSGTIKITVEEHGVLSSEAEIKI